uniref:C-type lectin domain-containing protein n=1 Tax=Panagrolaimus sp. PS1159 TaxID=55785 RepID=A0AC35GKQ3_9BILA
MMKIIIIWVAVLAFLSQFKVEARTFIALPKYQCPTGWDVNPATKLCYKLINRPMPQIFAQQYCKVLDPKAKLLRIQDKQENDFVREYTYGGDAIWIGAKAKFDIIDRKWANANCNQNVNFVCERKIEEPAESAESESSECPRKWIYRSQTKSCYRAFSGNRNITWLDGDKLCGESGAESKEDAALVSVTNAYENKFVMDLARRRQPNWQYIFLGAIGDTKSRKHWDWVDGNAFKQFHNWELTMPRGNRRMAVLAMARNGRWQNTYADQAMPGRTVVVCKFTLN